MGGFKLGNPRADDRFVPFGRARQESEGPFDLLGLLGWRDIADWARRGGNLSPSAFYGLNPMQPPFSSLERGEDDLFGELFDGFLQRIL